MDDTPLHILLELIQFDMQQIQNYREAIFEISVTIIAASFGISAFIYRKDNTLSSTGKSSILISANAVLFLVLIGITYSYEYQGLKVTRCALELRESALTAHLFQEAALTKESLYPALPYLTKCGPKITSLLECIPLYIAMCIILIKAIAEGVILRSTLLRQAQQGDQADAKDQRR